MTARWFEKAIDCCLDVDTFQDADADGVGNLDYLARLGVDCV
jgi:hypothetical protein